MQRRSFSGFASVLKQDSFFRPNESFQVKKAFSNLRWPKATATLRSISSSLKCVLAVAFLLVVCGMQAQQPRKVISRTNPVYPPVLKDKEIGGLVRILVVVTPTGNVKQTEDIGGNPALVIASEAAVKQWKFEPAANETREIVTLRFDPTSHR
jgi:protein TonB